MDIKVLEEIIPDIDKWEYGDLKKIKLLTKEQTETLMADVPYGYHSDKDIIDACVTALYYMKQDN